MAADLAFSLFVVVQIAVVSLILKSGFLKTRCHVALRAVGGLLISGLVSCFLVFLTILTGVMPGPVEQIERAISAWIQRVT